MKRRQVFPALEETDLHRCVKEQHLHPKESETTDSLLWPLRVHPILGPAGRTWRRARQKTCKRPRPRAAPPANQPLLEQSIKDTLSARLRFNMHVSLGADTAHMPGHCTPVRSGPVPYLSLWAFESLNLLPDWKAW